MTYSILRQLRQLHAIGCDVAMCSNAVVVLLDVCYEVTSGTDNYISYNKCNNYGVFQSY